MFNRKKLKRLEDEIEYVRRTVHENYWELRKLIDQARAEIADLREFLGVEYVSSSRHLEKKP